MWPVGRDHRHVFGVPEINVQSEVANAPVKEEGALLSTAVTDLVSSCFAPAARPMISRHFRRSASDVDRGFPLERPPLRVGPLHVVKQGAQWFQVDGPAPLGPEPAPCLQKPTPLPPHVGERRADNDPHHFGNPSIWCIGRIGQRSRQEACAAGDARAQLGAAVRLQRAPGAQLGHQRPQRRPECRLAPPPRYPASGLRRAGAFHASSQDIINYGGRECGIWVHE